MLSPQLTSIAAQQHVSELHRTAADHRRALATRELRRPEPETRRVFARRLRRFLPVAQPASR